MTGGPGPSAPPGGPPPLSGARLRAAFVLVAALAGTIGYAIFLHRGPGQGDFKGYPIGDWLFWKIGGIWAWGIFLSLACVSAGHLLLSRGLRMKIGELPTLEAVVDSAAAGLLIFVLGMYLGGFARLFHAWFAVLWPSAMLAAGARPLLAFARERHAAWRAEPRARDAVKDAAALLAAAFGLFCLTFVYLGAMTPESINFDASWSHLTIAADYARAGRIVPFDGDYTRNYPHLASIVHTWPMILPAWGVLTQPPIRWMMALHLEFFFFLWTLGGVAAMAAWLLDVPRVRGAWAAFFLFPAIFVYDCNLGGAADHYLAVFGPPLFLAAVRAAPRFEARSGALVGLYAAGALLSKLQAVYLIAGVGAVFGGLWIAAAAAKLRGRAPAGSPSIPELARGPLALVAAFAIATSPHFLKNWAFYHNPLYPFGQGFFRSHPTSHNAAYLFEWLFKDYNWRPHGGLFQTVGEALGLTLSWSFAPHYSFTRNVPDGGALFTLCLPLVPAIRAPRRIALGYAAGMGALFAWGMIFRVDRHLQTFMPLLAAVTAAVLVRAWELGWAARAGLALLVGLQVVWGGDAAFYSGHARIQAAIDLIRSGYEGRARTRFDGFRANDRAIGAALPEDARVVLHMYRPNLGIDRDLVLDWAGQQALIFLEDVRGPRGLYDYYRARGVTHLLWLPGRRPAVTKQEDVLFTDLVHRFAKSRRRFGPEELVALPTVPPPPDHPYEVLSLGLGGYADGLYPVEAMKTYEDIPHAPGTHESFAPPEIPLPRAPEEQAALAARADAVCLGARYHPAPALQARINALFETGAAWGGRHSVLVRRPGSTPAPPAAPPR